MSLPSLPKRKAGALIGRAYHEARRLHGIERSKSLAAVALLEVYPHLTPREAREHVESWYVGDFG